MEQYPRIISIVGSKGGTGKTLFTSMLGRALANEGKKVLLIDLDLFVRGLSTLVAEYNNVRSYDGEGYTISELIKKEVLVDFRYELNIVQFENCDLLPSFRNILDPIDYDNGALYNYDRLFPILSNLYYMLTGYYDVILIDNKASLDIENRVSINLSNIVISVSEDDILCKHVNKLMVDNLKSRDVNIYTVINKGRNISTYEEFKRKNDDTDYGVLGIIPFDISVMEEFGRDVLWRTIFGSLYFRSLIDVWNNLALFESVPTIDVNNYVFPPDFLMPKLGGKYLLYERVFRFYSLMIIFFSLGYYAWYKYIRNAHFDQTELFTILGLVIGIIMYILSSSDFRQKILPLKLDTEVLNY